MITSSECSEFGVMLYVGKHGFYFASSIEQEQVAQELCKKGTLQSIENILPSDNKSYFYVRGEIKSKHELPYCMWQKFNLIKKELKNGDFCHIVALIGNQEVDLIGKIRSNSQSSTNCEVDIIGPMGSQGVYIPRDKIYNL